MLWAYSSNMRLVFDQPNLNSDWKWQKPNSRYCFSKGTVSRDFWLQVFFMNHLTWALLIPLAPMGIFWKFATMFGTQSGPPAVRLPTTVTVATPVVTPLSRFLLRSPVLTCWARVTTYTLNCKRTFEQSTFKCKLLIVSEQNMKRTFSFNIFPTDGAPRANVRKNLKMP